MAGTNWYVLWPRQV